MISRESFSEAHIRDLQKNCKRDPILLERSVYALGLLEALARVGMPFIFKGGSSLMLLLDHPMRLSTDIDIVVEPGTDVDRYIEKASVIFPFTECHEQKRIGKNSIEKRHFKFVYDSPINEASFYILLDVLFENNNYERLTERSINNNLLICKGDEIRVSVPSADCLLGDKLTAFAPHTTGIPLEGKIEIEVMKQFYDICSLIDVMDDFGALCATYERVARSEIGYRGLDILPQDCLKDTIRAAVCIGSRGKQDPEEYPFYVKGARNLKNHIFAEAFNPEIAAYRAPKVAHLAVCVLADHPYGKLSNVEIDALSKSVLTNDAVSPFRAIRKISREGYAYAVRTDQILRNSDIIL